MFKIDLKDKKIISQLDDNSRQSNSQIGRKVGLSKEVVGYRINRLEESALINGYYSLIDFYKLGYFSVRVYLKLINASKKIEDEIINFLKLNKTVFYLHKIDGSFDIGVGTYVKSIYDFEKFYNHFKEKFKAYLGNEKISIFTRAYHFNRSYILEKRFDDSNSKIIGGETSEKIDHLDEKILRILAKNARIEIINISLKLKVPANTIAFRIKQLEKRKIILGYKLSFNFKNYGYEYYKVDLNLNDFSRIKELYKFAHLNPNILYIDDTLGGSDFEFDLEVKDRSEFLNILYSLRDKFPEIRSFEYFNVREYIKLLYFPEI